MPPGGHGQPPCPFAYLAAARMHFEDLPYGDKGTCLVEIKEREGLGNPSLRSRTPGMKGAGVTVLGELLVATLPSHETVVRCRRRAGVAVLRDEVRVVLQDPSPPGGLCLRDVARQLGARERRVVLAQDGTCGWVHGLAADNGRVV